MTSKERRGYFRIDDCMSVSYRCLTDDEIATHSRRDAFNQISDLERVTHDLQDAISSLLLRDPLLAKVFSLLNRKITLINDELQLQHKTVDSVAHQLRRVNISASGVAFLIGEQLEADQIVGLEITIKSGGVKIRTLAKVVSCELNEAGGQVTIPVGETHYLRLEYEGIASRDRDLLVQHLLRRQILHRQSRVSQASHSDLS